MTPRERHTPKIAKNTSLRLTREEREAIHEISTVREANGNARTRSNDILVDALWDLYTHTTGKTRRDIEKHLPPIPVDKSRPKIAQMPSKGKEK